MKNIIIDVERESVVMEKTEFGKIKHSCLFFAYIIIFLGALNIMSYGAEQPTIVWEAQGWGVLGIAHLKTAPFPDESRKDGFVRDGETFPFEGHYDDSSVGFIIPPNFKPEKKVDFIIIFHGHRATIHNFLNCFQVGRIFNEGGRNAILVLPQGPKNSPDSAGGKLENAGAFTAFMNDILISLKNDKKIAKNTGFGNVIICGYSGGGRVTGLILNNGDMKEYIKEVWLIDAAYQLQDELIAPFIPANKKIFRSIFTKGLLEENAMMMHNLSVSGIDFAVVSDDRLTTSGMSSKETPLISFKPKELRDGKDELPIVFTKNRIVFAYTRLPHDGLKLSTRFLRDLITSSPYLNATK